MGTSQLAAQSETHVNRLSDGSRSLLKTSIEGLNLLRSFGESIEQSSLTGVITTGDFSPSGWPEFSTIRTVCVRSQEPCAVQIGIHYVQNAVWSTNAISG